MLTRLLSLLFPSRCAGCARYGTALCQTCLGSIPLSALMESGGMTGIYDYNNPLVRTAIRRFKYYRQREIVQSLINYAAPHITALVAETTHAVSKLPLVVIPVPIHAARKRERGFNQSAVIAQEIARILSAPLNTSVLRKIRATESQTHMRNKTARLINMRGSMHASNCDKHTVYIVIDDVATTAATFTESTRALREAGARHVLCIALAHGGKH